MLVLLSVLLLSPSPSQAADNQPALQRSRASAWPLEMSRGVGTGFLLKMPEGTTRCFTAHHVAGRQENCREGALQSMRSERNGEKRVFPFRASPESCAYDYDIVSVETQPGASLEPVLFEELPKIGERVIISGHPLKKDSRLTTIQCTLRGFDFANHSEELAAYIFSCDGVNWDVGGMSGSAVVSLRTGKAIAVLTSQMEKEVKQPDRTFPGREDSPGYEPPPEPISMDLIIASPIYQKDGKVSVGYPLEHTGTNCYNENEYSWYRCNIRDGKITE